MEVSMKVTLSPDELSNKTNYRVVAEATLLSSWNTGRRKRKMAEQFADEEMEQVNDLISKAKRWASKGVHGAVEMPASELIMWVRLANFCGTL